MGVNCELVEIGDDGEWGNDLWKTLGKRGGDEDGLKYIDLAVIGHFLNVTPKVHTGITISIELRSGHLRQDLDCPFQKSTGRTIFALPRPRLLSAPTDTVFTPVRYSPAS